MSKRVHQIETVPSELAFARLDRVAAAVFPRYSRSRLQTWIKSGELTVDGELRRPKDKVLGGEELEIDAAVAETGNLPEDIALDIVHEDASIVVVNKPAGLVVHPGAGNPSGTLLNGLLHHYPDLAGVPRAGIVHRLDKDTTGLLVVARTLESQNSLVQQLQAREVKRIYEAIAYGVVPGPGVIDAPIGRNPGNRLKMAVLNAGKEAVTRYRVLRAFREHSHVELSLETGRTHQIRVHMEKLAYPLIGDVVYGGRFRMPRNKSPGLIEALRSMSRQALHARKLVLMHPETDREVAFETALPEDMAHLLSVLEASDAPST